MLLTWLQLKQYSTPVSYSKHIPFPFCSIAHLGLELFPLAELKEGAWESRSWIFLKSEAFNLWLNMNPVIIDFVA